MGRHKTMERGCTQSHFTAAGKVALLIQNRDGNTCPDAVTKSLRAVVRFINDFSHS